MLRKLVRVLIVVASVALALVGADLLSRVYAAYSAPNDASLPKLFEKLDHSQRIYRLKPGAQVLGYEINSLGFRGAEFARHKTPGTFRIVNLGDSIAFGMGVRPEEGVLARLLEARLNRESGRRRFEVINAGVPGYNSRQELAFLREELVPDYAPDLVILSLCLNDADPVELDYERQTLLTLPHKLDRHSLNVRALVNESYLFRMAKAVVFNARPALRNIAVNERIHEAAWNDMKGYVAQMDELLRRRGVGFLVVIFPWRVQLESSYDVVETHKDLVAFFAARAIAYLDLFRPFQRRKGERLYLKDGVHSTEIGNRIAADETVRALMAGRLAELRARATPGE